MSRKIGTLSAVLAVCACYSATSAGVITLSGGDPGEGFTPGPIQVYAYNLRSDDSGVDKTIQDVDFTAVNVTATDTFSDFTLTDHGVYPGNAGTPSWTVSTLNDTNLEYINTQFAFVNPAPLTLTLKNLAAGSTYQVDVFVNSTTADGNSYTEDFTFPGAVTDDFSTVSSSDYYDVREDVVADGSGEIVVALSPYPVRLNAFAVAFVPEPASLGLLALGGVTLLRRRRA